MTIGNLKEELNELETLRLVTMAFADINALKVKKIYASFAHNYGYFKEIAKVYYIVSLNARRFFSRQSEEPKQTYPGTGYASKFFDPIVTAISLLRGRPAGDEILPGSESLKTLSVAITSNSHFHGNLNLKVIEHVGAEMEKRQTDLVVIGGTGIALANTKSSLSNAEPLRFKSDSPDSLEITNLLKKMENYQRITIFFPKFESVIAQSVESFDLSQSVPTEPVGHDEETIEPIFEPEISRILDFFTKEVRAVLFRRVLLETELSRTAARLLAMIEASHKTEDISKKKHAFLYKAFKERQNAELLETFSAVKAWQSISILS